MVELVVLRVFVGADGRGGNLLGVVPGGAAVPPARRQDLAAELGFSETIFLDGGEAVLDVDIYTPTRPIPFAGHPTVGAAWLARRRGGAPEALATDAGRVATWQEGAVSWIRADPAWAPEMALVELGHAWEVEALDGPPGGEPFAYCWAWTGAGEVRARAFAPSHGVPEDEATGSAAVRLVAALGEPLVIRQGAASELRARPGPAGTAEVGGAVALDEVRDLASPSP